MSKKKTLLILSILSVAVFAFGCSNANSESDSDINKATNNDTNVEENISDSNENDKTSEANNKSDENDNKSTDSKKSSSENNTQKEDTNASIYNIDLDNGSLVKNDVKLSSVDANSIFAELINQKIIPSSDLNSFEKKDVDGSQVGFLDVSSSFINRNLGSEAEALTLDAVAKTFKENLNLNKIKLTVDGKDYESGHTALGENDYL